MMGLCAGLAFLSSCATMPDWSTKDARRPSLPREVRLNQGAGRGDHIFLILQLEDGEKLPFVVDTGAPFTILDKSLAPKLGKRLGLSVIRTAYGLHKAWRYRAPKLSLQGTPLLNGDWVLAADLGWIRKPGHRIAGILGMDCLRHYCLQLDFAANRLRFLDPDHLGTNDLGKTIPLLSSFGGYVAVGETLTGLKGGQTEVDTGFNWDGALTARLYRHWTNHWSKGLASGTNRFVGSFEGLQYTDLELDGHWAFHRNVMGLRFLARHLVTLNFPGRTMYLRRRSVGPLPQGTNYFNMTEAWWETAGLSAASTPEGLADRILEPPNLRPAKETSYLAWWFWEQHWGRKWQIAVGPPAAVLRVTELPAANYRVKIKVGIERGRDGKPARLDLDMSTQGGSRAVPLTPRGTLILLHGYNSQKELLAPWAVELAQAGYRVVVPDLRGHGESSGQILSYGKYETAELSHVLDRVMKRGRSGRIGVLGIGYGANLALNWAARDPRVRTVVAIAPWDPPRAFPRLAHEMGLAVSDAVVRAAIEIVATRLGMDWDAWSCETAIRRLKSTVLLIAGADDKFTTAAEFQRLAAAAPAGSRTLALPGTDERPLGYDLQELAEPVKAWFREQL